MNKFFKDNSVVLFQGDSITDCGRIREDEKDLGPGYPNKIANIYNALFADQNITFINKGISGDRIHNLLERYDEDFLKLKPDFISILIGTNDTWHCVDKGEHMPSSEFEELYRKLLTQIKRDLPDTKIMIIEPFLIPTDETKNSLWHPDLDLKIQVVRKLAKEFADYFIPIDGIFQKYIVSGFEPCELSPDGAHPSDMGHTVLATEYLKTLEIL